MARPQSRRARIARVATMPIVSWIARIAQAPGLVILTYHRIADAPPPLDRSLWSATPTALAEQLDFLQREFEVIAGDDLERALAEPRGRRILITFDDGYRDNYELAYPVLREAGVPATFFLTTGFIDRPHLSWWDEIAWIGREGGLPAAEVTAATRRYKELPGKRCTELLENLAARAGVERPPASVADETWMTWDMARQMRSGGMSFGAHTVNHPILANLDRGQQEAEIIGSVERLGAKLDMEVELFSYPVGAPSDFDASTREIARAAGARFSFSNYGGYVPPGQADRTDLRRTNVSQDMMTPALLEGVARWPQIFARS